MEKKQETKEEDQQEINITDVLVSHEQRLKILEAAFFRLKASI